MAAALLWPYSAEEYFYFYKSGKSADFPDLFFHGKSHPLKGISSCEKVVQNCPQAFLNHSKNHLFF